MHLNTVREKGGGGAILEYYLFRNVENQQV